MKILSKQEIRELITPFDALNMWAMEWYINTSWWEYSYKIWYNFLKLLYKNKVPKYMKDMLKQLEFDLWVANTKT